MPETLKNSPIRVLVVEDHALTRLGLMHTLAGFPSLLLIGEADNGQEALKQVLLKQPDIVLMDIGLPIMDGITATRTIKTQYPQIRVIILTSHHKPQEIFGAFAAGADSYCAKDIRPERLAQAIELAYEGVSWLDPTIARTVLNCIPLVSPTETTTPEKPHELTGREYEVLILIVDGKSNKEIADSLGISLNTVKGHVACLIQKLSVSDRTQAAVKALREGLV